MLIVRCLGLLGIVLTLWGCHRPQMASEVVLRGQEIRPYRGLLRNFASSDISIPSQDSGATLILPAGGQMEYTVWQPKFEICGYADGRQVYYKQITIGPRTKYTFLGETYDFLAEVCPEPAIPQMLPQQCPRPGWSKPERRLKRGAPREVCPG